LSATPYNKVYNNTCLPVSALALSFSLHYCSILAPASGRSRNVSDTRVPSFDVAINSKDFSVNGRKVPTNLAAGGVSEGPRTALIYQIISSSYIYQTQEKRFNRGSNGSNG
jgi:hypothetical protein